MTAEADVEKLAREWDTFGRQDPLWAVLTEPGRHGGRWVADEFYETGRRDIASVIDHLAKLDVPASRGTVLDFGCGVGRLSRALAGYFDRVVGVDIAPTMIEEARRRNADMSQCEFICNQRPDLKIFGDATFDLIYSDITLQHVPRRLSIEYVREFLRLLVPGGVAVFHAPFGNDRSAKGLMLRYVPGPILDVGRRVYFSLRGVPAIQEMHVIPRAMIEEVVAEAGCQLAAADPSTTAGKGWLGYRYTVIRRP
jgi:SAM-dependent methyltransferase